jgi:SAM-dependent methyltransferase
MLREPDLPPGVVSIPRVKPRHLGVSFSYRLYRAVRLVTPRRWLVHALLDAGWITRQLAWDCVWTTLSPADALQRTRPHVSEFLEQAIPPGASVIDLGGGTGLVSRLAARRASTVLYVDRSTTNAQVARRECEGITNISFEIGEAFEVLRARGPFGVALMLHVLGFNEDPVALLETVRKWAQRVIVEVPDLDADPLNGVRLVEARPCYHDELYVVEFSRDGLQACLEAAGWRVKRIDVRNGALLALADA